MNTVVGYENISQRAAASFQKALVQIGPGGMDEPVNHSQLDLHNFFQALYGEIFLHPQLFGLPVTPDLSVAEDEPNEKDKKQAVIQKLKKPREMIGQALDFLTLAGLRGRLQGQELLLEDYQSAIKESGISKKFLQGLQGMGLGLGLALSGSAVLLSNPGYPAMLTGLQALAQGCAANASGRMSKFHFARCDFRIVNPGYEPDVLELYRIFGPDDYDRLARLHAYFTEKGYKTSLEAGGVFAWTVLYQGSRKIKATPLFQVGYEDRHANPLRVQIKCASTNRIADLLPLQPQFLQDDFMQRVFICQGEKCNWCRNQKTLGPSTIHYRGEEKVVCWFSNGDIRGMDDSSVQLIQQYAVMHDQLVSLN